MTEFVRIIREKKKEKGKRKKEKERRVFERKFL